jgi:putative PIN family toxin of toxin-antitoxin system
VHRVVVDTNVLVSGAIQKKGFPYKVVKAWEDDVLALVTSGPLIDEVDKVLHYDKIRVRYSLKGEEIKQILLNLMRYSIFISNPPKLNVIKEDPSDNSILAAAIGGKADYIISGDSHLLNLAVYKGISIVTPKEFCEITVKL